MAAKEPWPHGSVPERHFRFHRPSALACHGADLMYLISNRSMTKAPEAFSRVVIDAQLKDAHWKLTDGRSVRFEYMLPDGTKADYVLSDRNGRALAVVEAKRMAVDPLGAQNQARGYAEQLNVPVVFLANGREIWAWDHAREAHPHLIKTFYSQADLERRAAARATRKDVMAVATDGKIAGRPTVATSCAGSVPQSGPRPERSGCVTSWSAPPTATRCRRCRAWGGHRGVPPHVAGAGDRGDDGGAGRCGAAGGERVAVPVADCAG